MFTERIHINLFVFILLTIIIIWPINTSVTGKGIARAKIQAYILSPTTGIVSFSNAFAGSSVVKGQILLKIQNSIDAIEILAPIDGEINYINHQCQIGSVVEEGQKIFTIYNPNEFKVFCYFPIRDVDYANEGRKLVVYPDGNILIFAKEKTAEYQNFIYRGASFEDKLCSYSVDKSFEKTEVRKYFGIEGDLKYSNSWKNVDGMSVNALLVGKTYPLFWVMIKKFVYFLKILPNIIRFEPSLGIFLIAYLISFYWFLYRLFPRSYYYWFFAIKEMLYLKEQKERMKVPDNPPNVSVIIPAYNESKTILETINSMNGQNYPISEIIIVDDGSKDGMSDLIIDNFNLKEVNKSNMPEWKSPLNVQGDLKNVYFNKNINLIIKENGGKAFAIDCGVNICTSEYVCIFDADTIPDPDGVLSLVFPMLEDKNVKITSGRNQFVNESVIENGIVIEAKLPKNFYLLSQIKEFMDEIWYKAYENAIDAQTVLVGNFSCFQKSLILKLKGFSGRGITEDYDFNLNAHVEKANSPNIRIKSIFTARGWTQAPYTFHGLISQRARWSGGILDSLIRYRFMVYNYKYKLLGLIIMPRKWYSLITFPINFFTNLLGLPISLCLVYFSINGRYLIHDLFFYYYLPVYLRYFLFDVIILNYLDWKFVRSYPLKRNYIYLTFFRFFFGFIYDSLLMVCNLVGYYRMMSGRQVWGTMERSKFTKVTV